MTETDTSRKYVEKVANATVFITPETGATETAELLLALLARAEKAEARATRLMNDRLDGTWRDQVEQDAWNDAIEAAAHDCEQVAYSGKYPQNDQIELGCLRCRDSIHALRKGDTT